METMTVNEAAEHAGVMDKTIHDDSNPIESERTIAEQIPVMMQFVNPSRLRELLEQMKK